MRWIRLLYLGGGAYYAAWGAFVPVILVSRGFDPPLVALTSSLSALAFWLALPAWGHLSDVIVGTKRAIQLASVPAAVLLIALELPLPALPIALLCVGASATAGSLGALTDAHAVAGLADPSREYGRLRMLGSLSAGILVIGFGFLYDRTGYMAPPLVGAASLLAVASFAFRLPVANPDRGRSGRADRPVEEVAPVGYGRFGSLSEALHGRPRLVALLLGCLGIFIGIMGGGTFVALRLQALGGGPSTIGLATGLGASAEVPGMVLASWLVVRYGVRPVLGVSALGLALVFGSWAIATDPLVITATKMVAGLMFAGVTVAFVITMTSILPQRLVSTGQTLYQSVGFGAAAILSNFVGAFLYKLGGAETVFVFLAAATAAGGVVAVLAAPAYGRVRRAGTDSEPEPVSVQATLEPPAIAAVETAPGTATPGNAAAPATVDV